MKKMISHTMLPALFLGIAFLCTGCLGQAEINDLSLVSGAAVDFDKTNGICTVTAEVVSGFPDSLGTPAPSEIVTGTGAGFSEALKQIQEKKGKRIYLDHAQVILFSQDASEIFEPVLNELLFRKQARLSVDLLFTDLTRASEIWNIATGSTGSHAFDMEEMLSSSQNRDAVPRIKAYQAYDILHRTGTLLLPTISASQNVPCFSEPTLYTKGSRNEKSE